MSHLPILILRLTLTSHSLLVLTGPSPLKLFDIAKNEKRFLYTSAPMVRYSKASYPI